MEQKRLCLGILAALGAFATLRAFWTTAFWGLGFEEAALGTRIYNLLCAIGIWLAYGAVRRIPIRAE